VYMVMVDLGGSWGLLLYTVYSVFKFLLLYIYIYRLMLIICTILLFKIILSTLLLYFLKVAYAAYKIYFDTITCIYRVAPKIAP